MSREFLRIQEGTLKNSVIANKAAMHPSAWHGKTPVTRRDNMKYRRTVIIAWSIVAAELMVLAAVAMPRLLARDTYQLPSVAQQQGAVIAIRFVGQATPADINHFLETHNVSIIDEPQTSGFNRVRISDTPLPPGELTERISRLAQEKIVELIAAK
jgi:hypothetical protein